MGDPKTSQLAVEFCLNLTEFASSTSTFHFISETKILSILTQNLMVIFNLYNDSNLQRLKFYFLLFGVS